MAPPINLKQPPTSSAQTLARSGAPEARSLVIDAMRSATLASPPPALPSPLPPTADQIQAEVRSAHAGPRVLCFEEIDGRRWSYVVEAEGSVRRQRGSSVKAVSMQTPMAPIDWQKSYIVF